MKRYKVESGEMVIIYSYKHVEAENKKEAVEKALENSEGWKSYDDPSHVKHIKPKASLCKGDE